MTRYVWVTTAHQDQPTVHRAGCAHLRRVPTEAQVPLLADTLDGALTEAAADDLASDPMLTGPEDVVATAPCARTTR